MAVANHPQRTKRYGFLLLPGFSLFSLACTTEVLRVANDFLGGEAHEVVLLSLDGPLVRAAGGESIAVRGELTSFSWLSGLFVIAETVPAANDPRVSAIQSACSTIAGNLAAGCVFGGIGTGAAWLAHAGQLQGTRCTLSSTYLEPISAAFPNTIVSSSLYEIDRARLSCAGGSAGIDLMISWLAQQYGERMLQHLLSHFGLERLRDSRERKNTATVHTASSAKLAEAVQLMQSNLGEPLSTEEIAELVGVSRRQLERLFKQHLDTLPSRWYLEQRLNRAQRLLQQTSQSILQIGLSCGFTSGAHFSNAYRQFFARTPRDERSSRAAAWRAAPIIQTHSSRLEHVTPIVPEERK